MHTLTTKPHRFQSSRQAFTLTEVLVTIVVLAVLAGFLLPALSKAKQRSSPINCTSNLKQISLAFRMWNDDNDAYPMQYRTNNFDGPSYAMQQKMYVYFQAMSNELSTPKILVCPGDAKRSRGTNFTTDFDNSKVSYFVGLDATEANANMFLAGDRNISNGTPPHNGIFELTTNQPVTWTKNIHEGQGNILLTDGSVQGTTSQLLREALQKTGTQTTRLALP
jgi:prepilin-type N-terminal cleavage/methylation domain-containing protein